jgi:hypothetical protein
LDIGLAIRAFVSQPNTSCWFFSTLWFWSWETSVSGSYFSKTSLPPLKFAGPLLLYPLDNVPGVCLALGAIHAHFSWKLHVYPTYMIKPDIDYSLS